MQSFGGLCCPVCFNYLLKPVTSICGHSFCEYCLDEYFLVLEVIKKLFRPVQCVKKQSETVSFIIQLLYQSL